MLSPVIGWSGERPKSEISHSFLSSIVFARQVAREAKEWRHARRFVSTWSHHEGDTAMLLAGRPDGNLHVLTEGSKKIHESLDGECASPVAHQSRDSRLLNAEYLTCLCLAKVPLLDQAVNLQREAGFQ